MTLRRRTRDEDQDRRDRPTAGRHRGTRKARRERVPTGGRHARILEPTQSLPQPSGTR